MANDKPDLGKTLAGFFPDEQEINTQVIDQAKQYAHRQLGRAQARPVINALERLERNKASKKEEKK